LFVGLVDRLLFLVHVFGDLLQEKDDNIRLLQERLGEVRVRVGVTERLYLVDYVVLHPEIDGN